MQTFLPNKSFKESAMILDKKRCWKQVIEAKQILDVLRLSREGSSLTVSQKRINSHPATRMWRNYELALQVYYNMFFDVSVEKWQIKPVKSKRFVFEEKEFLYEIPKWLGYEPMHASHRSRLLEKKPEFYLQYNWAEKPSLENYWPVDENSVLKLEINEWFINQKGLSNG